MNKWGDLIMATYKSISWDRSKTLEIKNYKHTKPVYYVNITLTNSKITANFVPQTNIFGAYFGFSIGVKVWSGSRSGESSATIYGKKQWIWGNSYSYTHESSDDTSIIIDISGMNLPLYIQPVCTGCDHNNNNTIYHEFCETGCDSYVYEIKKAHTHINNPEAPTIIKTSGTTITVQASSGCEVGEIKGDGNGYVSSWKTLDSNNQYTFTGYSKGSTHKFRVRKKCSCGTYYYNDSESATTWNITNKTASKQGYFYKATCKAIHTPGSKGSSNTTIHYDLYKVTYNSSGKEISRKAIYTGNNGKTASSGTAVTFTGLTQNTNYVCVAYSTGIKNKNGTYDNKVEMKTKTSQVFSVLSTTASKANTSGFNIDTQVKHNDALNVKCNIEVYDGSNNNPVTKTASLPNDSSVSTLFDTLSFGTRYTIKCIYIGNSKDINEIYTITKTLVTSTKNADINIENIKRSARAVKFDVSTNVDIQAHINDDANSNRYTFYKCIKIFNDNNEEVSYDEILSNMGYNNTKWSEYTVIPNTNFSSSNSEGNSDNSIYKVTNLSYGIADHNNDGPGLLCDRSYIIYIKCVDNKSEPITESECTSTFFTRNFYLDFDILETTQNSIKCRIDVRAYNGNYTDSDEISTNSKYTHISNPSIIPIANNLYQNNSLSSYVYNATTNPNGVLKLTEGEDSEYEYRTTYISKTKELIPDSSCHRHVFTFNNLIYYCDHKVFVGITDGFNIVTIEQYIQTDFPYIWIHTNRNITYELINEINTENIEGDIETITERKNIEVSAGWHKAIPYTFINDEWVPAVPLIYKNGWKIPNGS